MNKIFSIAFFVGLIMTEAQGFIRGAHAQCFNCPMKQESLTEPEAGEEGVPHEVKRLNESIS